MVARVELDERVVVDEPVQPPRSHHEAGHDAPGMHLLETVGDDARVHKIDDAVGEHLRVNAQIVLVGQPPEGCVGDRANAHLQRRPIGHQIRHMRADLIVHRSRRRAQMFRQRPIGHDERVQARNVQQRVSMCSRHPVIHLGNHQARRANGRERRVD